MTTYNGPCAGDWMNLRVGEFLQRKDDPCHVARVIAIHNSATVKLHWQETGWFEFVTLSQAQDDFEKLNCDCGHAWARHVRTANGAYACKHYGCGCRDVVLP